MAKKDRIIRIIVKAPRKPPEIREVQHSYQAMCDLVGGLLECPHIPGLAEHGIDLWCNEEGKLLDLDPNFLIHAGIDCVCGPVFFASHNDEGDTIGLSDLQVRLVEAYLAAVPVAI